MFSERHKHGVVGVRLDLGGGRVVAVDHGEARQVRVLGLVSAVIVLEREVAVAAAPPLLLLLLQLPGEVVVDVVEVVCLVQGNLWSRMWWSSISKVRTLTKCYSKLAFVNCFAQTMQAIMS